MKKISAIILSIFSANFLLAAEPLFEQANNFYAAEKYEEAIPLEGKGPLLAKEIKVIPLQKALPFKPHLYVLILINLSSFREFLKFNFYIYTTWKIQLH